jgi:hypothetical protein
MDRTVRRISRFISGDSSYTPDAMTGRHPVSLLFAPTGQYVSAEIVTLTPDLAEVGIHRDWWNDSSLASAPHPRPIDRDWNWNQMQIEVDGKRLASETIAIITSEGAVQGAAMYSLEPVASRLTPAMGSLLLELLFTAPRNRPALRRDRKPFYLGVGIELLAWAAWTSERSGYGGRLCLDASPDSIGWYENRGLQKLLLEPTVFEGVVYAPMELSAESARVLLNKWNERGGRI